MILTLHDVLDRPAVSRARALLAQASWADGNITAGAQAAQMKNNWQLPESTRQLPELRRLVMDALGRHAMFFSVALPRVVFPPLFNRYSGEKNAFGDHVDGAIRYLPESRIAVRTDLSMTLFLSEPEEYDGGELVFHLGSKQHRIKDAAGSLVLYPSTTVHRVEPVTRGERLACFTWIQSLVRGAEHRALLHELDVALLSVRSRLGDTDPASIALTGCYHNLLRSWAEA